VGLAGLEHVVLGDGEVPGQFAVIGGTAELLGQGLLGGAHLQQQFLVLAADPDLPAPVAEVPFEQHERGVHALRPGAGGARVTEARSRIPRAAVPRRADRRWAGTAWMWHLPRAAGRS